MQQALALGRWPQLRRRPIGWPPPGAIQNFGGFLGGALAPIVTGAIAQATHSFVPALLAGAAIAFASAMIYLFVVRDPIPQASSAGADGAVAGTRKNPRSNRLSKPVGARGCRSDLKFGSRRQPSDLSSHGFSAGDDFVEHSVKRPEFSTNIVGNHPTADGIKRADALMINLGQSGIPKHLGDGGDDKENVDLLCKFRMLWARSTEPLVKIWMDVCEDSGEPHELLPAWHHRQWPRWH